MNDNWIEEKALLTAQRFAVSQHWNPLHISYNELIGKLSAAIAAALREAENRGLEKAKKAVARLPIPTDDCAAHMNGYGEAKRSAVKAIEALKTGEGR